MNRAQDFFGFTLIELVIVVTILAILAAVAVPLFQDLQRQARNSATRGALGAMREAIQNYRMNEIASGRADGVTVTGWPNLQRVYDIRFPSSEQPHIMENGDTPENPWGSNLIERDHVGASGGPKGTVVGPIPVGWFYNATNGEIWANSANNGGPVTENEF